MLSIPQSPARDSHREWMASVCSSPRQCTRIVSLICKQKHFNFLLRRSFVCPQGNGLSHYSLFSSPSLLSPWNIHPIQSVSFSRENLEVTRYSEVNRSSRCHADVPVVTVTVYGEKTGQTTSTLLFLTKASLYSGLVIWINPKPKYDRVNIAETMSTFDSLSFCFFSIATL